MNILKDVVLEIFSMFVSDAKLTGALILVIAISAALTKILELPDLVAGGFLLFGSLAVSILSVHSAARRL